MLGQLRATNVALPPPDVLDQIGLAARTRARCTAFRVLGNDLADADIQSLVDLLAVDPEI